MFFISGPNGPNGHKAVQENKEGLFKVPPEATSPPSLVETFGRSSHFEENVKINNLVYQMEI